MADGRPPKPALKRIYDAASEADGYRVLVDRMWPRGVSRDDAQLDEWLRDVAPSDDLRRWFGHDPSRWEAFRERYFAELDDQPEVVGSLAERCAAQTVTLLFAAKDQEHNNAVALQAYLERRTDSRG